MFQITEMTGNVFSVFQVVTPSIDINIFDTIQRYYKPRYVYNSLKKLIFFVLKIVFET